MSKGFDVTLLECIQRIPGLVEKAAADRTQNCASTVRAFQNHGIPIREILLIGSGTSNTAAVTAQYAMEKFSGVPVRAVLPNEYLYGWSSRRADSMVILISQTGTSILTQQCLLKAKQAGALTVAMCENGDKDLAKAAEAFLNMCCGYEEHPTRTIGFSMTVLMLLLLGMELGKASGNLSEQAYEEAAADVTRLPGAVAKVTEDAMHWLDRSRWQMLRSDAIVYAGMNTLRGVAMEASTKIWELPKIASFGYDMDECMHGPNYGLNSRHCMIVLDDGGVDSHRALALAQYMKKEFRNGLVVGPKVLDESDLQIDTCCGDFNCLLYAAAIQIQSYRLAEDCGRDLMAAHDNHVMYSYFVSHSDYK